MAQARRATAADSALDPGFFDSEAQQSEAWLAWSDRTAVDARIETLFTETLPRLEAAQGTENRPLPDDRFSATAFDRIVSLVEAAVLDENGSYTPENDHLADQFITYIGEWLVRRIEGVWFNSPDNGAAIYDGYGPAIGYPWSQESENDLLALLFTMAVHSDDSPYAYFVDLLYSRALPFADEEDRPELKAELLA
ncbi:hypothetical protein [Nocardia concava]|uniref:hypothetical protein n=1 Tax=Nocardia concava TaxID=257281 RepID=UPI000592B2D1|nr:hypothetical protein [Nocardia concava]